MKVELDSELENEYYKVQVKELELDGRYLCVRGIVLDVNKKEAFEFEDSIDVSEFCWNDQEPDEPGKPGKDNDDDENR